MSPISRPWSPRRRAVTSAVRHATSALRGSSSEEAATRLFSPRTATLLSPASSASAMPTRMTPWPSRYRRRLQRHVPRVTSVSGDDRDQVSSLRSLEDPVAHLEGGDILVGLQMRPGQLAAERDHGRVITEVLELGRCGDEDRPRGIATAGIEQGATEQEAGARDGRSVTGRPPDGDRPLQRLLCDAAQAGSPRLRSGPLQDVGLLRWVSRHFQGFPQERHGLARRAERGCTFGRGTQRHPRLGRERVGFRSLRGAAVGGQVLCRQRPGQLLATDRLEVARRRKVARPTVRARERVVRDLPDECLDEGVLAALGRSGYPPVAATPRVAPGTRGGHRSRPAASRTPPPVRRP